MTDNKLGGADQLYPQVTIDALPDNVLLEIFELDLGKAIDTDEFDYGYDYRRWQKLVHVCCRWRYIVFASPRRLDLAIVPGKSTKSKSLDIWPALPIVIWAEFIRSKEEVINIIVALRERDRVRKLHYCDGDDDWDIQDSLWKEIAAIDEPFPVLTSWCSLLSHKTRESFPTHFWVDLPHFCDLPTWEAFLIHQSEN